MKEDEIHLRNLIQNDEKLIQNTFIRDTNSKSTIQTFWYKTTLLKSLETTFYEIGTKEKTNCNNMIFGEQKWFFRETRMILEKQE